jgi:hypothetical protein
MQTTIANQNVKPNRVVIQDLPVANQELSNVFKRRTTMKTRLFIMIMAVAISVASASQARAQLVATTGQLVATTGGSTFSPAYIDLVGLIKWSSMAPGCFVNSTSSALVNVNNGTVTFNGSAYGDIYLTCPVQSLMGDVNAFGFSLRNDNGYVGGINRCSIDGKVVSKSTTTGAVHVLTFPSSWNLPLSGFHSLTGALSTTIHPSDFTSNMYWVVLHLYRDATLSCNPVADGAFLHYVIQ